MHSDEERTRLGWLDCGCRRLGATTGWHPRAASDVATAIVGTLYGQLRPEPIVLTRDRQARCTLKVVPYETAGLTLCRPSTWASVIHEREHVGAYAPAALSATELSMREISNDPDAAGPLINTGTSERRRDFDPGPEQVLAARPHSRLTVVEAASGQSWPQAGPRFVTRR